MQNGFHFPTFFIAKNFKIKDIIIKNQYRNQIWIETSEYSEDLNSELVWYSDHGHLFAR